MENRKWIAIMTSLLVVGIACPTEACRCIKNHLQSFYCNSNAVLQMKFIEPTQITTNGSQVKGYTIQVLEVFQGNPQLQSKTFISSWAGSSCEYHHSESEYNKEYLITAHDENGDLTVHACNYVVPWTDLTQQQLLGIQGAYSEGCPCNILYCSSQPCSSPSSTCVIEGDGNPTAEDQRKNQACVPTTNTTCIWKTIQ